MASHTANPRDLVLEKIVPLSAEHLWRGWTDPAVLIRWFTPAPWVTLEADVDPTPGGTFRTVMLGPNGERNEVTGCVLEVVEHTRFVWTSALEAGYRPVVSSGGFRVTAILEFVPSDRGTLYRATVRHATKADAEAHAEMGFEAGWSSALDQLVELFQPE